MIVSTLELKFFTLVYLNEAEEARSGLAPQFMLRVWKKMMSRAQLPIFGSEKAIVYF